MARKLELDLSAWPQACMGACGRILRPPHTHPQDYPQVKTAVSQRVSEPWCEHCAAALKGKPRGGHRGSVGAVEPEEVRLERLRAELKAMIEDRRRRGVPPEGIILPGDDKMHLELQRQMPGAYEEAKPRTRPLEETASQDAPLGVCRKGHPFTHRDPAGRRQCATCREIQTAVLKSQAAEKASQKQGKCSRGHDFTHVDSAGRNQCRTCREQLMSERRREVEVRPIRDGETCRRGHPYTHINAGHKYCPTCKAMSRERAAARRAASNAAE